MKAPENANYAATIVRIDRLHDVPGLDNLKAVKVLGYQALTASAYEPGELAVAFTAETQLTPEFASANNLYRHADLNADKSTTGYLEDNGRIKAIRLRGARSDALLLPLDALGQFPDSQAQLREGDTFDELDGVRICRKYVPPHAAREPGVKRNTPEPEYGSIPRHFDTTNYGRAAHMIVPDAYTYVSQKLHGTSLRVGRIEVERKLSLWERIKKALLIRVPTREEIVVIGSRNRIVDPDGDTLYARVGREIGEDLEPGEVVYGEIIGWDGDAEIQKGYTYGVPKGEARFYLYRKTVDGREVPAEELYLSQEEGPFYVVPLLDVVVGHGLDVERFADRGYFEMGYIDAVPTAKGQVDEGVCIRQDGVLGPVILKAKSPKFLQHETKLLDKGVVDAEEAA